MLKQLIQRLLDSRTTPSEAAHSAMPKPETPTIVSDPVTDKAWHSLIAPFDGYFSCKGIAKHMLIENSAAQWSGVTGLTSGGYMGFTLPMSKGSKVRYQLDHNSTGVMMTFSKTIRGGYNILVRRALPCLRPSFNFLLRSFSRVNGKQSKLGIFQKSETKLHSRQRQGKTLFTRLQRTDTFKSSCETARRVKNSPSLCTQEEMKTAVQGRNSKILMDGFLYIYPFSRVKLSRFSAQELSQTLSLRSIRTTNPQTGGALC